VLTSGEVQQLLASRGASLGSAPEAPLDSLLPSLPDDGRLYGLPGGSGAGRALPSCACAVSCRAKVMCHACYRESNHGCLLRALHTGWDQEVASWIAC
jgi:hypothetical protein